MERVVLTDFGNEALNWRAVTTGGTPGRAGTFDQGIAVAQESSWDYKVTASALDASWKDTDYNATAWPNARGASGYGEAFLNTVVPFGPDAGAKYPTTYYRKLFVLNEDPAALKSLDLDLLYDDGVVVYLNGKEVVRRALPGGTVDYGTLASEDREATVYETVDLLSFKNCLLSGTNVLAAEVHQFELSSADLVWDAELLYSTGVVEADDDFDGMPNDWETLHGFNPGDPLDAAQDADGDRQTNLAEYIAGTDPNSAASVFEISVVELTPEGAVRIAWPSIVGRDYTVSYSPDLVHWFGFGAVGDQTATGTASEFTDPSGSLSGQRFYRVEVSR